MAKGKRTIINKIKSNKLAQYLVFVLAFLVLFLIVNGITSLTTGRSIINRILKENTQEIPSVEIESDDYNNPASWHITKSAKWTGNGKAKVTFDLDTIQKLSEKNVDIVLVLDNSGSMGWPTTDKIDKIKEDTKELINSVLSNTNNKIALINFNSPESTIQSGLTNDKNLLINKVEGLNGTGLTNYNIGLKNVLEVLDGYQKQANRDLILAFMSDGEPNTDIHNQIATYEVIKDKYPYMTVNAVQYDMGSEIKESLKKVSDNQFWAYSTDTNNVLMQASISEKYENFVITDYIEDEYFYVKSVDDIKVERGEVSLEEENRLQKIVWNIGEQPTGFSSKMEINLTLKDKDYGNTEYFPTNEKETIETKMPDENKKTKNSDKTPVLKGYKVIYDSNPPTGCERESSEEKHTPYSNVTIKEEEPTCNGYNFKGWEIVTEDVEMVNADVFKMPGKDVHIKGTWGKPSIVKRMDGTVHTSIPTLYEQVELDYKNNNGAQLYDGEGSDTYENNVYYYTGNPNNNIIFGGFCWQMVRTTETGGVKIIYNGTPTNGQCNASGDDQTIGKSKFNEQTKSPAYVGYMYNTIYTFLYVAATPGSLYGNSFIYSNGTYTLKDTGTTKDATHHYTCNNTTGTCKILRYYYYDKYYIELKDGKSIEDALNEMLYNDDVNTKNSTIKAYIDNWYSNNMTNYTKYLEDTVFCNDRTMSNKDENGWNPNGGSLSIYLKFKNATEGINFGTITDLTCTLSNDKFTVSSSNGNGKLTYPAGLLTAPEVNLVTPRNNYLGSTGLYYWILSPSHFINPSSNVDNAQGSRVSPGGVSSSISINRYYGARPVVSLKPDTEYTSGTGTKTDPYIIKTE